MRKAILTLVSFLLLSSSVAFGQTTSAGTTATATVTPEKAFKAWADSVDIESVLNMAKKEHKAGNIEAATVYFTMYKRLMEIGGAAHTKLANRIYETEKRIAAMDPLFTAYADNAPLPNFVFNSDGEIDPEAKLAYEKALLADAGNDSTNVRYAKAAAGARAFIGNQQYLNSPEYTQKKNEEIADFLGRTYVMTKR